MSLQMLKIKSIYLRNSGIAKQTGISHQVILMARLAVQQYRMLRLFLDDSLMNINKNVSFTEISKKH